MTNICSEKSSGTTLLTLSIPRKKPKRFLQNQKKALFFRPSHVPRKCEGQKFFLTKPDQVNSIMVTNNNNSNLIPTRDIQGVSNRDKVGVTAEQQAFFSMDLNPEKPIQ